MSSHTFSRKSQTVPLINTRNRLIQANPCKGTYDVLERLDKYESRSMQANFLLCGTRHQI